MSQPVLRARDDLAAVYKPKELMLVLDCLRPQGSRWKALTAFAVMLAGFGVASAQTAPTLLPYTAKLIAGGGTVSKFTAGSLCPSSGLTAQDTYGDGCLATEIALTGPRYAVADINGNVFFSDYTNGLIRRVDAVTGVINLVAGSAYTSPTQGMSCGTGSSATSSDAKGDGCLGVQVNLYFPFGLAFSATGDLYFSETGNADVHKIAATAGVLPASTVNGVTAYTGVLSMVDGSPNLKSYGYAANNTAGNITAATQGYLDYPYGLAVDLGGTLYVAEEGKNAVLAVNTNATGSTTATGVAIPAGTVAKLAGASTSGGSTCPNYVSSSSTGGCNYGTYVSGSVANTQETDSPFGVAVDPSGNVYFANAYTRTVAAVNAAGTLTNYAGVVNTTGKTLTRGAAGSFAVGSVFSVAADASSDVYLTDPLNGVVWRADGAGNHPMYVVAGGAGPICATNTDSYGDGCPATQATFGSSPAATSPVNPVGVYGVSVDSHSDLFLGDTGTNLVREIASGTQFGQVGGSSVTNTLDIHFAAGDSPAGSAYTITTGGAFFSVGAATCKSNTDNTMDCLLPVTAVPATAATLGAFSGVLQVTSTQGGVGTFGLNGTFVTYPTTRTAVSVSSANTSCAGATTYAPGSALKLTATITSTGNPGGSVTFYANGTSVGTAQVSNSMASVMYTFTTAASYTITAVYSGDSYFTTSTGQAGAAVSVATPGFATAAVETPGGSIVQGQTGAYSFSLAQTVYTGTITFSVSGLPANSTAVFSPASISATGCSTSNLVTMSVLTQLAPVKQAGFGGANGFWRLGLVLLSLIMASALALRRRALRGRWASLSLVVALLIASTGLLACGKATQGASTPTGTYSLTVTATGSTGTTSSFTTPMTVSAYQDPYH